MTPRRAAAEKLYREIHAMATGPMLASLRHQCRQDLYCLLLMVCGRSDLRHDWLFERIREVEQAPDQRVDLWARQHRKSSIITQGLTLQEIIRDPNVTIAIISYNRPLAKTFLRWLKRECEGNELLKRCWPEVFWADPARDAPLWSEDSGLVVKRTENRKESTIEAYGLVDSQPVGRHPDIVVYDDVVVRDSVSSPDMIAKTTEAWQQSLAIGGPSARRRIVGTRWHYQDTYQHILDIGTYIPRIYPARDETGQPTIMTEVELTKLYREMGPAVFSAQMDLDPKTESELGFAAKNIHYYDDDNNAKGMNLYMLVDPAHSRKRGSSYSAIALVGLGDDGNRYWLDGIRDRISLADRIKAIFAMHRDWQAKIGAKRRIIVGYECYGTQASDIDQIEAEMEARTYRFTIVPLRGREDKNQRIQLMEPAYRDGRWWWPKSLPKTRSTGEQYELVAEFRDQEFLAWPFGRHPDMLDAMSRIEDKALGVVWPKPRETGERDRYWEDGPAGEASPWAA